MNEKVKAAKVLAYLEECDGTFIITVLGNLISDEKLAGLYDDFVKDGIDI